MKAIFIGIDGILNTWPGEMDPEKVERLNVITRATGAVVVVYSHHRYLGDMDHTLKRAGVEATVEPASTGKITSLGRGGWCVMPNNYDAWAAGMPSRVERAVAIQRWLDEHPTVERFAIVSAMGDLGHFTGRPEVVSVNRHVGLTDEDVARAVALLGPGSPAEVRP